MPGQTWLCDGCGKRGVVTFKDGEDVMSVTNDLKYNHDLTSPGCDMPASYLRVLVPENCAPGEAEKILARYTPVDSLN